MSNHENVQCVAVYAPVSAKRLVAICIELAQVTHAPSIIQHRSAWFATCTARGMTTVSLDLDNERPTHPIVRSYDATRAIPLAGRVLFSAIFLLSAPHHFTEQSISYAAAAGVPLASVAVPLAGVIALLGGLSVLLGFKAKLGAWMLVVFLVPVTLFMHRFWGVDDAQMAQMQMINFMKNVALVGGALSIAYFGAGPLSIDARIARKQVTTHAE
jgi:putative oxidoreductase